MQTLLSYIQAGPGRIVMHELVQSSTNNEQTISRATVGWSFPCSCLTVLPGPAWLLLYKISTGFCTSNASAFYPWQVLLATFPFAWLFSLGAKINGSKLERKEGRKEGRRTLCRGNECIGHKPYVPDCQFVWLDSDNVKYSLLLVCRFCWHLKPKIIQTSP